MEIQEIPEAMEKTLKADCKIQILTIDLYKVYFHFSQTVEQTQELHRR